MGLSTTIQPLVATLKGEKNTKAARILVKWACLDIMSAGAVITAFLMLFPGSFVRAFGIYGRAQVQSGITAVHITGSTLICSALLVFFFFYYYLLNRYRLALLVCSIKDFFSILGVTIPLAMLFNTPEAIWRGLAIAPVLSLVVCSGIVYFLYGKELFPFLIPGDRDKKRSLDCPETVRSA